MDRDWNIDRNWDIDRDWDVDVDYDWDGCCGWGSGYGWGAAAATAAWATAAAIGSTVYTLPPSCTTVIVDNVTYQQCGDDWYQPYFQGTDMAYIVVEDPD